MHPRELFAGKFWNIGKVNLLRLRIFFFLFGSRAAR
jgi:hypothetical protein